MHRREFLRSAGAACAAATATFPFFDLSAAPEEASRKKGSAPAKKAGMRFGLVTYQWGKDWDLPTVIANCEKADALGVELRTTHAHRVEPSLGANERRDVRKRFADSPVTLVGLGSNERFDHKDPAKLRKAIETTKAFLKLSHDVGSSGVKVKPNDLHDDVPHEKTIEQIGTALDELAKFGAELGQEVRLEVHGRCSHLPTMRKIMDVAKHEKAVVCWNSNAQDLAGDGLEHNFGLVKDRFGQTVHVRSSLSAGDYPYGKLIRLLTKMRYGGWVLLEDGRVPKENSVEALARERARFEQLIAFARARANRNR